MNTKFKNEGTVREELLEKFSITHGDMNENNIELKINFNDQIAKILCSKTLSDIIRNEKKLKLYLLNLHWLKIRKQKLRRRKKTLIKLYKMRWIPLWWT